MVGGNTVVQVTWRGMRRDVVMTTTAHAWTRRGLLGGVELMHYTDPPESWRARTEIPGDLLIDGEGQEIGIWGNADTAQGALDALDARLARLSQWIQGLGT